MVLDKLRKSISGNTLEDVPKEEFIEVGVAESRIAGKSAYPSRSSTISQTRTGFSRSSGKGLWSS